MNKLLLPTFLFLLCLATGCSGGGDAPPPTDISHTATRTPTPTPTPTPTAFQHIATLALPAELPTRLVPTLCSLPTGAYPARPLPNSDDPATPTETPVRTAVATRTLIPTLTPIFTVTPTPVILSTAEPRLQIGQNLPAGAPAISLENYAQLRSQALWGYGSIRSVEVAPDGSAWIVVSNQGIARYELGSLTTPPRWMPFSQPVDVIDTAISSDGRYLMLQYWHPGWERWEARVYVFDMQANTFVQEVRGVTWNRTFTEPEYSRSISVTSPDGAYRYNGGLTYVYDEEYHEYTTAETTLSEMYSASSGELLYTLTDPVQYVRYRDRAMPVACDLYVFSMCGNAVMALAMSPYQAAFSPDGETFAVLYRAPSLYQSERFSTLRIYRLADGLLLGQVGSFSDPVVDFTYLRGGQKMLAGFLDGSIRIVDVFTQEATWSAQHFQQPIWYLAYSHSGKYLVVQRADEVELRLANDGVLYGRYAATISAISPVEDLLAYGTQDGSLVLLDLDLPDLNGWQVLASMRQDPRLAEIPVIIISATDPPPLIAESGSGRLSLRLGRPFSHPEYSALLKELLGNLQPAYVNTLGSG